MAPAPFRIHEPTAAAAAMVVDSPHSGMEWPADFAPAAPREAILTTWDAFVDELWSGAPAMGATLVAAPFPRAYIDVNRAEDDIDPDLLSGPWPGRLAPSGYSSRGMGLIRRFALPGVPMYDRRLTVSEVERRVISYYRPYRGAVQHCLGALHARFGEVWHFDCHSMKSRGNAMNVDAGSRRPDLVVSDRHGTSADPAGTAWVAGWFRGRGYSVQINEPYQGGDLVKQFGDPAAGRHSIQIEINRALYMHEATFERGPRFAEVAAACRDFLDAFARERARR